MSSKVSRFFYLSISFILGIFFLLGGTYATALSWSSFLRLKAIYFILENTLILSLFGLGLALIGFSILIYAIVNSRRRYISICISKHAVTIDETLIQQYLETYWKEHFPTHSVSSRLSIKKNALQIVVDLPFIPKDEQEKFLNHIHQDFMDIFGRLLGYPHKIYLTASFQTDALCLT